jgi:hypothetical protein
MPIIAGRASAAYGAGFATVSGPLPFAPASAFDALSTVIVPSGGLSSITFAGIPQTGYSHLQLRVFAKTNRATFGRDDYVLRFNNDSSSAYAVHYLFGDGATVTSAAYLSQTSTAGGYIAANGGANFFGGGVTDILDYTNTNKYKTTRNLTGVDHNGTIASLGGIVNLTSGLWMNLSSINRIDVLQSNGTGFLEFSHFALYGVK